MKGKLKKELEELWRDRSYAFNLMFVEAIISKAQKEFPKCETWDKFLEQMKDSDVWSDVLDTPDVGKILDWMIEFMQKFDEWFGDENK